MLPGLRPPFLRRVVAWFSTALLGPTAIIAQSAPESSAEIPAAASAAVVRVLEPAGDESAPIHLLGATLDGAQLTLNFSRELLALEPGSLAFEHFSRRVHFAAGDALRGHRSAFEIRTLIDGVPLDRLLAALDRPTPARPEPLRLLPGEPPRQPLANRRIALSPGHGYYLNGSTYVLQRSYWSGIVEDFVNHDFITYLHAGLTEIGADVRPTRNLDRGAGLGETGFPKWQEAARYHVKALGADPSVWNESGYTHIDQDIRCRPRYANAVNADILVSLHNNGAGTPGAGTGTETLYDTGNGFAVESKRLADLLHGKVITAIRRDYNAAWVDRRVQGFNGNYGENRLATRPAVLMEVAFMDRPSPDNDALHDENFKRIVTQALREGIREYFDGPPPAAPADLAATGGTASIALTWRDASANEAGFTVERRADTAESWETVATLPADTKTFSDTAVVAATNYRYRIAAYNAGGPSLQFTNEVTAALSARPALQVSSPTATPVPVRDWNQEVAFVLRVADPAGRPVAGAALTGHDGLRNRAFGDATTRTDANGEFIVRATVPAGQADAAYSLRFDAAKPGYAPAPTFTAQVQVSHAGGTAGAPSIITQPSPTTITAGAGAGFTITTAGAAPFGYQWRRNGTTLPGATQSALPLAHATTADAGNYDVVVTNALGSVTSLAVPLTISPAAWLSNVSLRTFLTAGQPVIVGFVVAGGPKDILLRAAGPTLTQFGLTGAMTDPRLDLYRGTTRIADNNDWSAPLAPSMNALGAFPFNSASRDAALLQSLGGAHTVQVTGTTAGVVLVEGYDAGTGSAERLVNLSARNRVGTGTDLLIAGFFVAGTGPQRVLVRAVGPTLTGLGVTGALADPKVEAFEADGRKIGENDNWDPALAATFSAAGAFPLPAGSRDAALVLTLTAGRGYTVQVSGVASATGEALLEVYELP